MNGLQTLKSCRGVLERLLHSSQFAILSNGMAICVLELSCQALLVESRGRDPLLDILEHVLQPLELLPKPILLFSLPLKMLIPQDSESLIGKIGEGHQMFMVFLQPLHQIQELHLMRDGI